MIFYISCFFSLESRFRNFEVINQTFYEVALQHLDRRLRPTKIQICAAFLDPAWCNTPDLARALEERFSITRSQLLTEFINKYKLINGDVEDYNQLDTSISADETTASNTSHPAMSYRQSLLMKLTTQTTAINQNRPLRRGLYEEINEYFEAAKSCSWETEVLKWWGTNESNFPQISKLARLVLAVPATSAAAESAFSVSSCVVTPKRSKLSPFKASQVLFVHDNYDIVEKYSLSK